MPAQPSAFSTSAQWIAWLRNGAVSNKGVALVAFVSAETGPHRIQTSADGVNFFDAVVTADGVRTATIGDLTLNTAYTFRVRSENGGLSAWRTLAVAVPALPTVAADIAVPSAFAAVVTDPAQVSFTWTDNTARESNYQIWVRGPDGYSEIFDTRALADNPANGAVLRVRDLANGAQLTFATGYVAQIRAQGGKYKTRDFTPISTAWSAEIEFTTAAAQVVILNLPARLVAWKTVAIVAFTVKINGVATAFALDSGTIPAGLALNAGTGAISGTVTAAAGLYTAHISATDGVTTDIKALVFDVRAPALEITNAGVDVAGQIFEAFVGVAFNLALATRATGPVDVANAWTAPSKPSWLAINAGTGALTGTPSESGLVTVLAHASNGTQTADAGFSIQVHGVEITSAAELTVFTDSPVAFALTASPALAVFTAPGSDLPAGIVLAGAAGSQMLTGSVETAGDYAFDLSAILGAEGDTQSFTLHVLAAVAISGGETAKWDLIIDQQQRLPVQYNGRGCVEKWLLTSGPPGLVIDHANDFTFPCPLANYAVVTGAPTASGIYDAEIVAQVLRSSKSRELHRFAVRIVVTGHLFFNWFHDDTSRLELQLMLRSQEVNGYSFDAVSGAGLVLVPGVEVNLHVILRDAPIHDTELGLRTVETGLTELRLVIKPLNDYDALPYVKVGGTVAADVDDDTQDVPLVAVGDHVLPLLTFTPEGEPLDGDFAQIDQAPGADVNEVKIAAMGEVSVVLNGQAITSRPFPVTFRQSLK